MEFINGNFEQMNVETDTLGNTNMYDSENLVATQRDGIFPNTTNTFENGHEIAETRENIINGTDIIQNGEHTGIIKEDINGRMGLYDTNHHQLAYLDSEGNVKTLLNHADPLSQVDRINFQQLKFHNE